MFMTHETKGMVGDKIQQFCACDKRTKRELVDHSPSAMCPDCGEMTNMHGTIMPISCCDIDNLQTVNPCINKSNTRISDNINFTLCRSCFWCASFFAARTVDRCLLCDSEKIESMPITRNETYRLEYDFRRGIMINFSSIKS
jgi:hypothetical protein